MNRERVLVGFSGGMDSFAAAVLLKEQGFSVTAVHLLLYDRSPQSTERRLRALTDHLDIPLIMEDMRDYFKKTIITPFAESYFSGKTPNPCVWCNERVKLHALASLMKQHHADWMATGHYAKKGFDPGSKRWFISRGKDRLKDQSYFLSFVSQEHLERLLLPLGNETKEDLRKRVSADSAQVTRQKESHDICFLEGKSLRGFIAAWPNPGQKVKGTFIDKDGKVLGIHDGFYHYTIGQRRGIGIADATPYYVTALIPEKNQVQIGKVADLYKSTFTASNCRWHLSPEDKAISILCQIRYRHTAAPGTLKILDAGRAEVTFEKPQRAITPGQIAAFYQRERLIGAGVIDTVLA